MTIPSTRALVTAALLAAVVMALFTIGTQAARAPETAGAHPEVATAIPEASTASPSARTAGLVSYAVDVTELDGFPPDVKPGRLLDLWVAWEPPITKRTVVQPLLKGVVLEQVAPPVLPEGSPAALFLVPREKVGDLVWADRYGALSVVLEPIAVP